MAQKPAQRRRPNPAPARPTRRGPNPFVFGFVIGTVMVVVGGYLLLPPPAPPGLNTTMTTPQSKPDTPIAGGAKTPTPADPAPGEPAATAGYDFYTILQDMEVKVPDWQVDAEQGVDQAAALADGAASHVLQVGAFKTFADADRVKADLALKGIAASIQTVDLSGGERWFRVRIGPFQDLNLLKQARAELIEQGVGFIVVKERKPVATPP